MHRIFDDIENLLYIYINIDSEATFGSRPVCPNVT